MEKIKVFCFGNEFLEQDCSAKKIAEILKKQMTNFEFISIRDSFQILNYKHELENSVILDVVKGIKHPRLISLDELKTSSITTTHDFDLGFILKLLDNKAKIIGIPQDYQDVEKIREMLREQ